MHKLQNQTTVAVGLHLATAEFHVVTEAQKDSKNNPKILLMRQDEGILGSALTLFVRDNDVQHRSS